MSGFFLTPDVLRNVIQQVIIQPYPSLFSQPLQLRYRS